MVSRYCVQDMLAPETLRNRGLFDPKAVQKLMELDRSGYIDAAHPIFALVCIELWCRLFIDRRCSGSSVTGYS